MELSSSEENVRETKDLPLHSDLDNSPRVTIGIPAYNERANIRFLLNELLSQINLNVIEMIIKDDGSTDGTGAEVFKVAQTRKNHHCTVKLLEGMQRLGKAGAIGEILKVARGNIIVLIDADTRIGKQCVDKLVEPFSRDKNIGVVSGIVLPENLSDGNTFFSFISNFQRELNEQLSKRLLHRNLAPKVNGGFFAFRKEILDCIPSSIVSDDEYISWCAQDRGYKVTYAPDAKIYATGPQNVRDYLSTRRRILGGHFLIKNALHYSVPTTRIGVLLPEFGKLVLKYWKKMLYVIIVVFLESLCYPFAFSDAIQMKVSPRYRTGSAKFPTDRGKP